MRDMTVLAIERRHPEIMAVESEVPGQYYFFDQGKSGIAINFGFGVEIGEYRGNLLVGLTRDQAQTLVEELSGMIENFLE